MISAGHSARGTVTNIIIIRIIMDFPLTFFNNQRRKVFGFVPLRGFAASASERLQDRRSTDQTGGFSASKIRGAPQLCDSSE